MSFKRFSILLALVGGLVMLVWANSADAQTGRGSYFDPNGTAWEKASRADANAIDRLNRLLFTTYSIARRLDANATDNLNGLGFTAWSKARAADANATENLTGLGLSAYRQGGVGDVNAAEDRARSSSQKRAWIDVTDAPYNADSTGSADCTAAIQAAHDALPATGGTIVIPAGTFKIVSVVNVTKPNVHIMGSGRRMRTGTSAATLLNYTGTGNVLHVANLGFLMDLVNANYPRATGAVIDANNIPDGIVRDCYFEGTPDGDGDVNGVGIQIDDGSGWRFDHVRMVYLHEGIALRTNNSNTVFLAPEIDSCEHGIVIDDDTSRASAGIDIVAPDIELCMYGLDIGRANGVHVWGGYMEAADDPDSRCIRILGDSVSHDATGSHTINSTYMHGQNAADFAIYIDRGHDCVVQNVLTTQFAAGVNLIQNNHTDVANLQILNCKVAGPVVDNLTGVSLIRYTSGAMYAPAWAMTGTFAAQAALLADGNDTVVNGAFTSSATGWTAANDTLASVAGGQSGNCLSITVAGGSADYVWQELSTIAGHAYYVTVYHKNNSDKSYFTIFNGGGLSTVLANATLDDANWTQHTLAFTAVGATSRIAFHAFTDTDGQCTLFDTVVMHECALGIGGLPVIPGAADTGGTGYRAWVTPN